MDTVEGSVVELDGRCSIAVRTGMGFGMKVQLISDVLKIATFPMRKAHF